MTTINSLLIFGINSSRWMVNNLTADLKPEDWLHRPCPKSNCAAWIVGHLTMVNRWAQGMAGITDLPALSHGFETTFSQKNDAPQAASFGDTAPLVPLFNQHCDLFANAINKMPDDFFDQPAPLKNHPRFTTMGEFLYGMVNHSTAHCGQITTIRRMLGYPPLF